MATRTDDGGIDRRRWLRATAAGVLGSGFVGRTSAAAQDAASPTSTSLAIRDVDPEEIIREIREAGLGEPRKLRSNHYLAIGDAAESFMRSSLTDCEMLLLEYLQHFKDRSFEVHEPTKPLIVVAFRDDRSFGRYHKMPSLMQGGPQPVGMYDKTTNILSVFDWRNVPMASRAASKNVQTVAHEGTHQLTFNTGLLDRTSDIPLAVIEGLGTYGEPRKVIGPSELGRMNLQRADDLAKLRRSIPWIPARDLLADDVILRAGSFGRVMLAYAESWALTHLLLHDKDRIAGFREYLKAVRSRTKPDHRLDDVKQFLGDLDDLDRDLQAHAVSLVRSI